MQNSRHIQTSILKIFMRNLRYIKSLTKKKKKYECAAHFDAAHGKLINSRQEEKNDTRGERIQCGS